MMSSGTLCPFPGGEWGLCSQSMAQMDCLAHTEVTTAHEELEAWNTFSRRAESRESLNFCFLFTKAALWLLNLGPMQMATGLLKTIKVNVEDV